MADNVSSLRWDHEPPAHERQVVWKIERCPPGAKGAYAIVLSHRLVGTHTHYYGGRTRPCTGENCTVCEKGHQPRWKGYLACTDKLLQKRLIIEIPARACSTIDEWFCQRRTLRGSIVGLKRIGDKANSRVLATMMDGLVTKETLPEAPNVQKILLRMWEVQEFQATMPTVGELRILPPTGTDDGHLD